MCGRFTQKSAMNRLGLGLVRPNPHGGFVARYNAAPGQEHWVIRQNPKTGERTLDALFWGLIPHWCKDSTGGRKPINAKAETVSKLPTFRDAYRHRRCLVPIDSFFEWRAVKGHAKQPYAIAMKSGEPFALAGIWENWQDQQSGTWLRSFAIITGEANARVAEIHDRMPVIIPPEGYDRWLSPDETDPHDLLVPFPAELMLMWPISTRVNKPSNDDAGILDEVAPAEG